LCSHEICLEYALLVVGSTPKFSANFTFIPNFAFPKYSTRISLSPVQWIHQLWRMFKRIRCDIMFTRLSDQSISHTGSQYSPQQIFHSYALHKNSLLDFIFHSSVPSNSFCTITLPSSHFDFDVDLVLVDRRQKESDIQHPR
jgi:hypothetical protein